MSNNLKLPNTNNVSADIDGLMIKRQARKEKIILMLELEFTMNSLNITRITPELLIKPMDKHTMCIIPEWLPFYQVTHPYPPDRHSTLISGAYRVFSIRGMNCTIWALQIVSNKGCFLIGRKIEAKCFTEGLEHNINIVSNI